MAAAIGIACGAGQYRLVAVGAGLGFLLLTLLKMFERFLPATPPHEPPDKRS